MAGIIPYQYIDVFAEAGAPAKLKPHIIFDPIWPQETLERHTEILRQFFDTRSLSAELEQRPREILNRHTLSRIQTLVTYAYNHIPFYRRLYTKAGFEPGDLKQLEDFALLPVVQKSDIKDLYLERIANSWIKVNHKSRTSGSTGVPLSLINDSDRQNQWFVLRLRMFEHMAGQSLAPKDWLYSIYYEPFLLTSILGDYKTFTVGLGGDACEIADHIRRLRPKIVTGVASHIFRVAKFLPDAKELGILAFTTNSETSSPGERKALAQSVGVPFLDEYSSEELGIIAWEDRQGSYLVAEDTVHLELVTQPGEDMASVIGTDLWNFAMPRIRYVQGDYAEWEAPAPAQGQRRLKRLLGRQDMKIISAERGPIDAGQILEIFDGTLVPESSGIEEFRLVQKSPSELRLLLKRGQGDSLAAIAAFTRRFVQVFGENPRLQIDFVDKLPSLGVKRRCIVRDFHV